MDSDNGDGGNMWIEIGKNKINMDLVYDFKIVFSPLKKEFEEINSADIVFYKITGTPKTIKFDTLVKAEKVYKIIKKLIGLVDINKLIK